MTAKQIPPLPTHPDVEIIERETAFEGYFTVDRYTMRHKLFGGGMGGEIVREVFERGHAAAGVLYDPKLEKLVMIEQFRPGALAAGWEPWLTEIVAGIIEDGETPADVIRREAVEEANCQVLDLEKLCTYLTSPGGSTETVAVFCAQVDASNAGGIHGLADEGEDIRVSAVPVAQAMGWLDSGKINNSMTMIGLQWFRMRHDELRAKWTPDA